jgi:hypothetical protein
MLAGLVDGVDGKDGNVEDVVLGQALEGGLAIRKGGLVTNEDFHTNIGPYMSLN